MNRNALIVAFALTAVTAMTAHASGGLIIRGGVNIANSTLDPKDGLSTSSRAGLETGILFDIAAADRLHFLIGGLFDQKGFNLSDEFSSDEAEFRLNYFTIPIMMSFRGASVDASGNRAPVFFVNAGVELSPLTSAEVEFMGTEEDYTNATGFDFGLRGEMGIEIPTGSLGRSFLLGAGYSYGLTNSNDADDNLDPPEQHNYAIKLFAAYKFGFAPATGSATGGTPAPATPPAPRE